MKVPYRLLLLLFFLAAQGTQAQVKLKRTVQPPAAARTTAVPNPYYNNLQMTTLYKELQHFSTIAPLGELGAGRQYVFSADINPLFIFSNSIRSRWNLGIGARLMARMFRDSSLPVRTPSYMPHLRVFYRIANRGGQYRFADLSFTHHSNGQEGPARVAGQWNERGGNFSTNWLAAGYHWGQNEGSRRRHFAAFFQQHLRVGSLLEQEDSLKGYYGQTRVGLDFQSRRISSIAVVDEATGTEYFAYDKERLRVHAYLHVILAGLHRYPGAAWERRFNGALNVHYFLKSLREGGFFAGLGYYGEDPYNIYFHHHYFFARFGFSAGMPLFSSRR